MLYCIYIVLFKLGEIIVEIKDLNYINDCVNFVNGFGAKQIRPLSTEMIVTKQQIDEYKMAVTMCLKSKCSLPNYCEFEKKSEDALFLLDQLLKYKKVSRIPR